MHDESDLSLVSRAQAGDRTAFEEVVRRTSRLVFAHLYLETGDRHRAEDLLQETWLLAYRSLARLKDPAHLRRWLLAIAHNVLTDDVRYHTRKKRGGGAYVDVDLLLLVPAAGPGPEEAAERAETRERVLDVLRALPEEYRLPLTLHYIAGADAAVLAAELGRTQSALRGVLYRGLKLFRERLGPEFALEHGKTNRALVEPK